LTIFPLGVVEIGIRVGGGGTLKGVEVTIVDPVLNVDLGVDVASKGGLISLTGRRLLRISALLALELVLLDL